MEMNNPTALHPITARHIVKSRKTALKPEFAKEPFSPSRSEAVTKQHRSKFESLELIEKPNPAYNNVSYVIGQQVVN